MDLDLAIWQFNPAAQYTLNAAKTAIAEWRGPGSQPTQTQLDQAWADYQDESTRRLPSGNLPANATPDEQVTEIPLSRKVVTLNVTPVIILSEPMAKLRVWDIEARIMAITSTGLVKTWHAELTIKRLNGGAIDVGSPTVLALRADTGTSGLTMTAGAGSGATANNLVVTVAGVATWMMRGKLLRYAP